MNKLDLIVTLKLKFRISKEDATQVMQTFFDSISDSLISGERVEIRGFCSFFVKNYKGYTGRNPKTGENVKIKSKKLPFFKCGGELRKRVDY